MLTARTTMNYYLVNLSIADLMITLWCPVQSLVREMSEYNEYALPAVFCKIGVFYTGGSGDICLVSIQIMLCSAVHGVQRDDPLRHLLRPLPGRHLPAQNQSHSEEGQVHVMSSCHVIMACHYNKTM